VHEVGPKIRLTIVEQQWLKVKILWLCIALDLKSLDESRDLRAHYMSSNFDHLRPFGTTLRKHLQGVCCRVNEAAHVNSIREIECMRILTRVIRHD
jgi:hypothetical protein